MIKTPLQTLFNYKEEGNLIKKQKALNDMIQIDNMYRKGFKMSQKSYNALQNDLTVSKAFIEVNFQQSYIEELNSLSIVLCNK